MGSRRLSILCRSTPVPKLSDPIMIGSPAAAAGISREYPGVFALATLLPVTAISCWLTESEVSAIERDPNKPDMFISPALFSSPEPDFCSKQAGIGRVGGSATVDHAIQDGQTALQVPQQRPVHSREISDPGCERLPVGLQPRGFPGFVRIAGRASRWRR